VSSRRQEQAAQTRLAVLETAMKLFSECGWTGTTIATIAREAGVSKETIYAIWGTKAAILAELAQRAVRGDEPDTALLEQAAPKAVMAAPTARARIDRFARDIAGILARVAPVIDVVRTAAEQAQESAELYATLHAGRRRNLAVFVDSLAADLRPGLSPAEATEEVWRLASPELYQFLTKQGGFDRDAYSQWLSRTLERLLLA